jgi:hypothetical protein
MSSSPSDADLGACPACDGFIEPDLLDEDRVLHQAQQCRAGWHQRSPRLLLGQALQAAVEVIAVFVKEGLELGLGWLINHVLGGRPWER